MIEHNESISLTRKFSKRPDPCFPDEKPSQWKAGNLWKISISGDIEDDPASAIELLHELQGQVNKIREAYGTTESEE